VEIGGVEINVINGILKIMDGQMLYSDPAKPTYDIIQYSPVYYYVVAGIAEVIRITPEDPHKVIILTRTIALIVNLFTAISIFFIARRFNLQKTVSIFAAIFTFVIQTQHYYSRGDSLYCLLFFISFLFFVKFVQGKRLRDLVFFTIFSIVCILTKQTGMFLLFIAGLYLLIHKKFREIFIVSFIFIVISLLFYLIAPYIGGIESVYRNVILGVKNGYTASVFKNFLTDKHYFELNLWIIIGFYLSVKLFRRRTFDSFQFLLFLLFSLLIISFITLMKNGASINYFVECFILAFVGGLIYINTQRLKIFPLVFYSYFLLSLLLKTGGMFSSIYISRFRNDDLVRFNYERDIAGYLLNEEHLKKNELIYLEFRGYTELFLTGNAILNQKDINYFTNIYAKSIDYSGLLAKADKGHIKYLVSKNALEDILLFGQRFYNFKGVKTINGFHIYKYALN
jgi:hypothetical protein